MVPSCVSRDSPNIAMADVQGADVQISIENKHAQHHVLGDHGAAAQPQIIRELIIMAVVQADVKGLKN